MNYNEIKDHKKYYGLIYSYDNFQYDYEEEEIYFDNIIECMKELLRQKKENKDFQKILGEPKLYLRIRKYEETEKEVFITDYKMRKYKNRYFLRRAENII